MENPAEYNDKSICLNLSENERAQLDFIMHEIHGAMISIDSALHSIAKADFSQPDMQQKAKEEALNGLRSSVDLRLMLDFWQISNNADYFENAVARPQKLWNKFCYLNSYMQSLIQRKHLQYDLRSSLREFRNSPIADFVGYPIINAIANILLDNAIKYSPDGDTIICEFEDDPDELIITVENNGPYVAPEEIEQLFLCGMRGKNADKAQVNGHGYGMNFLQLIVNAHDGEIEVESSHEYNIDGIPYGKYTCRIYLPKYAEEF